MAAVKLFIQHTYWRAVYASQDMEHVNTLNKLSIYSIYILGGAEYASQYMEHVNILNKLSTSVNIHLTSDI